MPAGIDPRGVDPVSPNPLLGLRFFVDRMEPAYGDWAQVQAHAARTGRANLIWRLAREPRFRWFGRFTRPQMVKKVRGFLARVQCDQPGTVPQMMVMRHQGVGCASELPRRRRRRGQAHARVVRRLRPRDRRPRAW